MTTEIDIHAPGVECIRTQCYFCHANCGVLAYVKDGDVIKIEGDPDYTNQGGLCCRGTSALLHVNHPGRVNHVLKRVGEKGEGKWEQVDYDQAIQEVADRLNQIKAENGAESVASCGGTTRTDDWARRRFLNQFGTPNGFHNALLCWIPTFMAETCVAGWSPFETDLGGARCLVLWGMNPGASTLPGMHGYWDLIHNGMKCIVVDPRYSETAAKADLWLPVLPGTDAALALAMLYCAVMEGLCNFEFCATWCDGFDELMGHLGDYTPEWAEEICGIPAEKIRAAATMYCTNTPGCIQWGCTWDQMGSGSTTTSHALQLLRAVTGNLEVPGGDGMPGPAMNYLTDEELELNELLPEAIKDKQIGSNKFKLASWPGYTLISKTNKRTWGKTLPAEWFCEAHGPSVFKAILTKDPYEVRALIVNASNPMMSYGDSKMVLAAIKAVEFLVVVDYWITPTALFADYVFPAAGALERPVIVTHYGATDSLMGGRRAMQPKYDRHTDMDFWRKLGLACGQDPANWPWETEEEAYWAIMEPIGLPVSSYNEFVDKIRMYYPPLHQSKYLARGGFWTPTGKIELNSTILQELGYPGMPTYIGCSENPIDHPDLAKEYPIRLTTGGGFMPYHHSEHFNMPYIRYISPDPYFSINPDTAAEYDIKERDWCWIETRRGRIKMRADVDNVVAPGVIMCPRGWWFPERDGSADLDNPFGCLESNVNTLTSVDDEHCDPMGGSWANRGLLCKIYKCTANDNVYTYEDTKWSIPGSDPRKGKTFEDAVHRMPKEVIKARPDLDFEKPKKPAEVECPDGFEWAWQDGSLYHKATNFKRNEAGWIVSPRDQKQYDPYTLWTFDAASNTLLDAEGKKYSLTREPIAFLGSTICYPGRFEAPYELPSGVTWDKEKGVGMSFGHPYNNIAGWCIDPQTNVYYDVCTGYALDPANDCLVDATGKQYDKLTRLPKGEKQKFLKCIALYPGVEFPPFKMPSTAKWDKEKGYATAFDHPYDPKTGWCIEPDTDIYYDPYTGYAYDPIYKKLVDQKTGKRYDIDEKREEAHLYIESIEIFPGFPNPPFDLPKTATWNKDKGYAEAFGKKYDPTLGWCIDFDSKIYYDPYTGLAYDPSQSNLVDQNTGERFEIATRARLEDPAAEAFKAMGDKPPVLAAPTKEAPEGKRYVKKRIQITREEAEERKAAAKAAAAAAKAEKTTKAEDTKSNKAAGPAKPAGAGKKAAGPAKPAGAGKKAAGAAKPTGATKAAGPAKPAGAGKKAAGPAKPAMTKAAGPAKPAMTKAAGPAKPAGATKAAGAAKPAGATKAAGAAKPTKAAGPAKPAGAGKKAAGPAKPTKAAGPAKPAGAGKKAAGPAKPAGAGKKAAGPAKPAGAGKAAAAEPAAAEKNVDMVYVWDYVLEDAPKPVAAVAAPAKAAGPAKPAGSTKAAGPAKPAGATKAAGPAKPAGAGKKAAGPAKPAMTKAAGPAKPAGATKAAGPAKPAGATKAAGPAKPAMTKAAGPAKPAMKKAAGPAKPSRR